MSERTSHSEGNDVLDDVVAAVLQEPVPADAVRRVAKRALELAEPVAPRKSMPRPVASYRFVRYGGIAAVLIGLAVGAVFWAAILGGSRAAFAQVVDNVRRIESVQLSYVWRDADQPERRGTLFVRGDRIRLENYVEEKSSIVMLGDFRQERVMFLNTSEKLVQEEAMDQQFAREFAHPIDQLRLAAPGDVASVRQEMLDGQPTQVFELDRVDLLGFPQDANMTVWADVNTRLPVKISVQWPESNRAMVFQDFQWGVPIRDELLALQAPENFQVGLVVARPRDPASMKPLPAKQITAAQREAGILSVGRVPHQIAWTADGSRIIATLRDPETTPADGRRFNELRCWDVATGEVRWSVDIQGSLFMTLADDDQQLAVVRLPGTSHPQWEVELRFLATGEVKRKWRSPQPLGAIAFSPDGDLLAAAVADWDRKQGGLLLWNSRGELVRSIPDSGITESLRFSRDGRYVAGTALGQVKVWEANTGSLVRSFPGGAAFDFSFDGERLATVASQGASARSDVQIYDLAMGNPLLTLRSPSATTSWITGVQYHPEGRLLAVANWDGEVRLWDTVTGQPVEVEGGKTFRHGAGVGTIQFSPDGSRLATGSEDGTLRLWRIAPRGSSYP